jgi:hypothetical protein
MIDFIRRAALAAALAACMAGCGGGSPGALPPAASAGSGGGSGVTPSSLTYALSANGSTFALPAAGPYAGTVSFPAFAAPAGAAIAATATTDPPPDVAQAALRRPRETGQTVVYYYLTLTPLMTITLPTVPGFAVEIGTSLAQQDAAFYYAISAPPASGALASFRTEGPAAVSGTKATFTPSTIPLTLRAGVRYVFAFYSQARVSAGPPYAYAANADANTITAYSAKASGNVAPDFTIAGPATGLNRPDSVATDAAGNVYAANRNSNSITVYAHGASGDAAPVRTIAGSAPGLVNMSGIAVDASGRLVVSLYGQSRGGASVRVFAPGANGNAAPLQTITSVNLPSAIAVDAHGEIIVSDFPGGSPDNPSLVKVYAPSANGPAPPLRSLSGPATGLVTAGGFAVDEAQQQLYVANGASVLVFALQANGNVAPVAQLAGPNTLLSSSAGIALAPDALLVASRAQSVLAYARGATGDVAPIRDITGPLTGLAGPAGLAVGP